MEIASTFTAVSSTDVGRIFERRWAQHILQLLEMVSDELEFKMEPGSFM